MFCRECGKPVEDDWNTCPYCKATIFRGSSNQLQYTLPTAQPKVAPPAANPQYSLPQEAVQTHQPPQMTQQYAPPMANQQYTPPTVVNQYQQQYPVHQNTNTKRIQKRSGGFPWWILVFVIIKIIVLSAIRN